MPVPRGEEHRRVAAVVGLVQRRALGDVLLHPVVVAVDAVAPDVGLLRDEPAGLRGRGRGRGGDVTRDGFDVAAREEGGGGDDDDDARARARDSIDAAETTRRVRRSRDARRKG